MKVIKKPYEYFGYQCEECGCYFIYTKEDVAIGELNCPCCKAPFEHSIHKVDCEPSVEELTVLHSMDLGNNKSGEEAMRRKFLENLAPGDKVYVAYDCYYAKGGQGGHFWVAPKEPFTIRKAIITKEDGYSSETELVFTDIVYKANDPRQHCRETFQACLAFPTYEDANEYANQRNK